MTKFADRGAPGYEDIVGELQRLAGNTGIDGQESRPTDHVAESNPSKCVLCIGADISTEVN
jgi:hypothetical protein